MNLENEISIIILNYFNYKLTTACVDNLLNLELESRIIIVDNNSQNESYKYLKDYYRNTITVDVIKKSYDSAIKIFKTSIPVAVKAAEASSKGQSIFSYDSKSPVAMAYSNLTKEVLNCGKKKYRFQPDLDR